MKINAIKIGKEKPEITIVGCLHGDEIIGKRVIDKLKKIKLKGGSLKLIVANEKAMEKKQRIIASDLNRSFPGKKKGGHEEHLAYLIKKEIEKSDLVIDIHATTSNFARLAIITNLQKQTKNMLRLLPCKEVALMKKAVFGGGEMIRFAKVGIGIEYGPDKTGNNYKKALDEILAILKNLGMINGAKKTFSKKELYTVRGAYKTAPNFKASQKIKNFKLIRKGEIIGEIAGKKVKSKSNFYPIFVGEKSYKGTLAIMADKSKLNLLKK